MRYRPLLLGLLLVLTTLPRCPAAFLAQEITNLTMGEDKDGDGVDDEMEALLGTNPEANDTDGDGWDDLAELIHDTDPTDPTSFPAGSPLMITSATVKGSSALGLKVSELLQSRGTLIPAAAPAAPAPSSTSVRYYYLPSPSRDLAVEVDRTGLKAGDYLLLWRHRLNRPQPDVAQRYLVSIRDAEGQALATWDTPDPVDATWRYVGKPFRLSPKQVGQAIKITLTPAPNGQQEYMLADFVLVKAGIESDANRDGTIAEHEHPENLPLRHWINDDEDRGEAQERADLPGRSPGQADWNRPGINGLRDLVDFLPLNLDLFKVVRLLKPSAGFRYFISHADRAIQIVPTGLSPTTVGSLHREAELAVFGPTFDEALTTAEVLRPDPKGRIELPEAFLDLIKEQGHGIVLLEGTRASQQPLTVEIEHAGRIIACMEQPCAIAPVESMYRHVNLTSAATEYSGRRIAYRRPARGTQTGSPAGLPDSETADRWIVLLHGYNVAGDSARGWHAETFKRLYVLGSRARFVGLTWDGDTGLDYHKAVYQAFQTGAVLPRHLTFLDESRTLLLAHSLGNIVASQAIEAGFTPATFCLLNAALPIESIIGEASFTDQAAQMTEAQWRPYAARLYASAWAATQAAGDQRQTYTWRNTFARVRTLPRVLNFYSPGEDITNCPAEMTSASVLATLWSGRAIDYGVWKTQELLKGVGAARSLGALMMERSQAGWGFNPAWRGRYVRYGSPKNGGGYYERLTPAETARLTPAQLQQSPFFTPFIESWLHLPSNNQRSPLLDSPHIRYDLLARAIPALSYAAGAIALPANGAQSAIQNFDLEALGRRPGAWPQEGHTSRQSQGRWLHSDFKNVALPFVFPFFARLVADPSLQ